jgi:hypothetical protein
MWPAQDVESISRGGSIASHSWRTTLWQLYGLESQEKKLHAEVLVVGEHSCPSHNSLTDKGAEKRRHFGAERQLPATIELAALLARLVTHHRPLDPRV